MHQFVRFVIETLLYGFLSYGILARGDIQFRISKSELEKVASVLLKPRDDQRVDVGRIKLKDVPSGFLFELTNIKDLSKLPVSHMKILSDGRMLATLFSSLYQYHGNLTLSRSDGDTIIYNGPLEVSLINVTVKSLLFLDNSNQNLVTPSINCSAEIDAIEVYEKMLQGIQIENANVALKNIFQKFICRVYSGNYSLAFKEPNITCTIFEKMITLETRRSYMDIQNNSVVITYKVKTSKTENRLSGLTRGFSPSIPLTDSSSQPFEIVLHASVLNELFKKFKREIGIGVHDIQLDKILPMFKAVSKIDTQGIYMSVLFPMVGKKYPDAVGTLKVSDADIYFTIKNGSAQIHFDINAALSVTLNCDKNRTFQAFTLTMNLFFPIQIGFDNHDIKIKILKFGGKFTIADSNVGHVMDRGLSSLLYSAPYYLQNKLHHFDHIFQGIPLTDLLPKNLFAEVKTVSVDQESLTIGGRFSLTDPQLPRVEKDKIHWTGSHPQEDLVLLGIDNTPKNPKDFVLLEENCKTRKVKSSEKSTASQSYFQFASLFLWLL